MSHCEQAVLIFYRTNVEFTMKHINLIKKLLNCQAKLTFIVYSSYHQPNCKNEIYHNQHKYIKNLSMSLNYHELIEVDEVKKEILVTTL